MDIQGLLYLVIWLAVIGLAFYVIWWLIGFVGLPQPFDKVLRVIVAIVAAIIVVSILLNAVGMPPAIRFR
jgi:hypothetical protein